MFGDILCRLAVIPLEGAIFHDYGLAVYLENVNTAFALLRHWAEAEAKIASV